MKRDPCAIEKVPPEKLYSVNYGNFKIGVWSETDNETFLNDYCIHASSPDGHCLLHSV